MTAKEIQNLLRSLRDSDVAEHSQGFFKTGKGEYGEGDIFLGIRVPVLRKNVKKYKTVSTEEILPLLKSRFHEERLFALLVLVMKFSGGDEKKRKRIYELYMENRKYINNWDLIDATASHIVGAFLMDKDKQVLYDLAKSKDLWEKRISIMATFYFIRKNDFKTALEISEILMVDKEDLIHKAVGWMLREIGKRDASVEKQFLKQYYYKMPRTMLRYAIEKFPKKERKMYLQGSI